MRYLEVDPGELPLELLLEADPSESNVAAYLRGSIAFFARDEDDLTVGACVLKECGEGVVELHNIAVHPDLQGQGLGSKLLDFVITQMKSRTFKRIELGTGSFGYQLSFYQRLGFRVDSVRKDHFIENYTDPIYENGIQHRDMLRLYLDL